MTTNKNYDVNKNADITDQMPRDYLIIKEAFL